MFVNSVNRNVGLRYSISSKWEVWQCNGKFAPDSFVSRHQKPSFWFDWFNLFLYFYFNIRKIPICPKKKSMNPTWKSLLWFSENFSKLTYKIEQRSNLRILRDFFLLPLFHTHRVIKPPFGMAIRICLMCTNYFNVRSEIWWQSLKLQVPKACTFTKKSIPHKCTRNTDEAIDKVL